MGEPRRVASRLRLAQGFDESARGRIALIITELGTHLESVSGDACGTSRPGDKARIGLADGLGHGSVAAEAADAAMVAFAGSIGSTAEVLEQIHPLIRSTRGVAMAAAVVDASAGNSDGLTSRWKLDEAPGLIQCDPDVVAGWAEPSPCIAPASGTDRRSSSGCLAHKGGRALKIRRTPA